MKTVLTASALLFAFAIHSQPLFAKDAEQHSGQTLPLQVQPEPKAEDAGPRVPRFKRADVLKARFGAENIGVARAKASHLAEELDKVIFGQELVNEAIEATLTQYLEDFGHRKREPIHINLMGFPGSGKTALVQKIEKITGVKVVILNAQTYVDGNQDTFAKDIREKVEKEVSDGRPVILAVDEIDKVPEISNENGKDVETTSQFIGGLNSMISEGKIFEGQKPVVVSNVMLITMMNYPPTQIESFSKEVLEVENKSYYEFKLEDFAKFDTWLRNDTGASHRILAKLFRANTVSRLAPNTLILQSFTEDVYRYIINHLIKERIEAYASGAKSERQLQVEADPSLTEFFVRKGIVPSSGARETVNMVDVQFGRLLDYAQKAAGPKEHGLDRPRRVKISVLPGTDTAQIEITPRVYRDGHLEDLETFSVQSQYIQGIKAFRRPAEVVAQAPILKTRSLSMEDDEDEKEPRLTKKEIRATRFPPDATLAKGMAKELKSKFFDQDGVLTQIESDVLKFLSRNPEQMSEPTSRVLAGFPGNPAVKIIQDIAKETELPLLRINLSQFTGDDEAATGNFQAMLEKLLEEEVGYDEEEIKMGGRYILLLEGLEELTQKDAMGNTINRPVMGFIKEMLASGKAEFTDFDDDYGMVVKTTAASKALIYLTYNFPVESFGFEADPRMTSVDDVQRAFQNLTRFPTNVKEILSASYKPDTVSTLMPRMSLMAPYKEESYKKIILQKLTESVEARLHDKEGVNRAQIVVDASPAYMSYLYEESVIASEGATNTETTVRSLVSSQLEAALDRLPRTRDYSGEPLQLKLDFDSVKSQVTASIRLVGDKKKKPHVVLEQKVSRMFPSTRATGKMKAERLDVAAHEFGHAFAAVTLGYRINRVLSVPLKQGHGGFVSFKAVGDSAAEAIADLYISLASRALERMVSNENPADQLSVLNISQGSSRDIEMATETLYTLLFELGLAPHGGTLDRRAKFGPADAANIFPSLQPEDTQKMSFVLHDLENYMVDQFLKAHPLGWYLERIHKLAVEGSMTEKEFYELVDYPYPGDNRHLIYRNRHLEKLFKDSIIEPAAEIKETREAKVGDETVEDRIERYAKFFATTVEKRFGFKQNCEAALVASK